MVITSSVKYSTHQLKHRAMRKFDESKFGVLSWLCYNLRQITLPHRLMGADALGRQCYYIWEQISSCVGYRVRGVGFNGPAD